MNERLTATVVARINEFRRKMAEVNSIARMTARDIVVNVKVRTNDAIRRLDRVAQTLRTLGEVGRSMSSGSLLAISPSAIPVLGGIVASLAMLGPMLGTMSGSMFALASAFGVAGAGAAAFGAVAVSNLNDVFAANSDIKDLQEDLEKAETGEERAEILKEIEQAQSGLNKEQQKGLKAVQNFSSFWSKFASQFQKPILDIFTRSIQQLQSVIEDLEPTFQGAVKAFNNLSKRFSNALATDEVQGFFDYLNRAAGPMIETLGRAFGNFTKGIMSMVTAFEPLTKTTAQGFLEMSQRFAEWSSGLKDSKSFQAFVKYTQDNMPKIRAIFRDAIAGMVYFFAAFGPLASDMMSGLADMMGRFKDWSRSLSSNKGFQNFVGYIRDNGPEIRRFFSELTSLFVNIVRGMAPLGSRLLELTNNFMAWINGMSESNGAIGKILGVILVLVGVLKMIAPPLFFISSLFSGVFGGIAKTVTKFMKSFGKMFAFLMPKIRAFALSVMLLSGGSLAPLVAIVAGVIAVLVALGAVFVRLWNENEKFRAGVMTAWNAIKTIFVTVITAISEFVMTTISALVTWWKANQNQILNVAKAVWDTVYNTIVTVLTSVWNVFATIIDSIQDLWSTHGDLIMAIVFVAWKYIESTIITYAGIIWTLIKSVLRNIKGIFQAVWPIISGVVQIAWGLIEGIVKTGIDLIAGLINTTMSLIKGDWEGAWNAIQDTAQDIWDNIESFFSSVDLVQIGEDIIGGLITGIKNMAGATVDAVKGVGDSIKNGFTNFFSINSPSRLMEMDVGRWITAGVGEGMLDKIRQVTKAAKEVAQASMPQLNAQQFELATVGGAVDMNTSQFSNVPNQYETNESQTVNMQGVFEGAELTIREDADIDRIAEALGEKFKDERRSRGRR